MTSWVIVAIPSEQDHVWQVSSEKVPHLTLLYLGEQDGNENELRMVDFIEHATSTSLNRFGLSVDRRGTLGEDNADVLFFDKRFVVERLRAFRSLLLQNTDISLAYNSVEQYPDWTPHLTLGYPETPAKADDREYPISWINFDRIALWTGDSEGYEIPLDDEFASSPDSVAMSESFANALAQSGVKGMKWGVVKKDKPASGDSNSKEVKQVAKQQKRETKAAKFDLKAATFQTQIDEINKVDTKNIYRRHALDEQAKDLSKVRDRAIKDAQATRDGKLTSNQKKVIIGASIVAAILVAKGAHDLSQSGEGRRLITKGRAVLKGQSFSFLKNSAFSNKSLSPDEIQEQIVKGINPDFGKMGTKMNCRRCTFTYEMRRRGYDVAATRTTNAHGQNVVGLMNATNGSNGKIKSTGKYSIIAKIMKEKSSLVDPEVIHPKTPILDLSRNFGAGGQNRLTPHPASIFEKLAQQPDGSRGELGVQWAMGGGHSMAYEIVHGKPVIFDGQTGKKYTSPDEFFGTNLLAAAGFTRLDNVELNENYLMRWLKNAG